MAVQNQAAEDLANLTQAAQSGVDQAERLAARDREAGQQAGIPRNKDGEARAAVPEGIATGIAAGFILGPVGGLVMGIAQAWMGKRERQNVLDQWAADNDTWNAVEGVLNERIADLADNATNDNDIEQLHALQAQQDAALKLVRAGSATMQQRGVEMLADIDSQVNAYTERQETQRIEQEAIDAQLARELDDRQYMRYQSLQDDFQAESQSYEDTQSAVNIAMEALERGTPADLHAALILVNKALDPTSVVREEEARAIGNLGNWFQQMTTTLNATLGSGQQASVEQRQNLMGVLQTIADNNIRIQLAREARYTTELDLAGLDKQKYREPFQRVQSVPAYERQGMQNTRQFRDGVQEGETFEPDQGSDLDAWLQQLPEGTVIDEQSRKAVDPSGNVYNPAPFMITQMEFQQRRREYEARRGINE